MASPESLLTGCPAGAAPPEGPQGAMLPLPELLCPRLLLSGRGEDGHSTQGRSMHRAPRTVKVTGLCSGAVSGACGSDKKAFETGIKGCFLGRNHSEIWDSRIRAIVLFVMNSNRIKSFQPDPKTWQRCAKPQASQSSPTQQSSPVRPW